MEKKDNKKDPVLKIIADIDYNGDLEAAARATTNCVLYAVLGIMMHDEGGKEVKIIVPVSSDKMPTGIMLGDKGEMEVDGERAKCVLLGVGVYDLSAPDDQLPMEEILKAFCESIQ